MKRNSQCVVALASRANDQGRRRVETGRFRRIPGTVAANRVALPRFAAEGMSADGAFVDGSHVSQHICRPVLPADDRAPRLDDYW